MFQDIMSHEWMDVVSVLWSNMHNRLLSGTKVTHTPMIMESVDFKRWKSNENILIYVNNITVNKSWSV